jgi:transcriptional regulator with XRE-family HTH domain
MARNGNSKSPKLKIFRHRKGMTQQELADVLGIARTTVAWLESPASPRTPGRKLAAIVGDATGRSAGQVMDEYERLRRRA